MRKGKTIVFSTIVVISVASQHVRIVEERAAGCCYVSFWTLAVKSENLKSLPTAWKNKEENLVQLERLILSKCHL